MKPHPFCPRMLLIVPALLAGCATLDEFGCDMHENKTRGVKPVTTYKIQAPKTDQITYRSLPAGSLPQVRTYKMTFKPGYTKPCSTLILHKDVVVLRSEDKDLTLTEIREFYAEDGTLITSNAQDITEQVLKSGAYIATTPLPIPKTAPPGKYKIVSRLQAEKRGDRKPPASIIRAEGYFYIVPRQ